MVWYKKKCVCKVWLNVLVDDFFDYYMRGKYFNEVIYI